MLLKSQLRKSNPTVKAAKMLESAIVDSAGGVRIKLHVHPGTKRNGISGLFGDALKFDLQTPPVDGKANAALIKLFSKILDCPRSSVILTSGETSRNKVLEIRGIDKTTIITILNKHIL